jgi:magnesium-transporting ATPase (P-type)
MFKIDLNKLKLSTIFQFVSSIQKYGDRISYAFIVDGKTLGTIFKHKIESALRSVCMLCDAVLCCRMSPSQKASVSDLYVIKALLIVKSK